MSEIKSLQELFGDNDTSLQSLYEDLTAEEDDGSIQTWHDTQPLFSDVHNPNQKIFIVPTQDGHDSDDQGHGSIGDATMKHVSGMSHRLLEMEHFICTPDGNLFSVMENVGTPDAFGERQAEKEILDVLTNTRDNLSVEQKENLVNFFQSEIEERKAAQEERNDVMDQVRIPYHLWETMPQMTKDWDVPATPKPRYIYAGKCSQMFYDYFPEEHPDAKNINAFLTIANNIDIDQFDERTLEYFTTWCTGSETHSRYWNIPTVVEHIITFCEDVIADMNPDDAAIKMLQQIDSDWQEIYSKKPVEDFKNTTMSQRLDQAGERIIQKAKRGSLVSSELGSLGSILYRKYGDEMTTPHWEKYKKIKKDAAPAVMAGNVNLNKASQQELVSYFSKTRSPERARLLARDIFFMRPIQSMEKLFETGLLTLDDLGYTDKNMVLVKTIKSVAEACKKSRNLGSLNKLAAQIIDRQQTNPDLMTEQDWTMVWQTYRLSKKSVKNHLGLRD